MNIYSSIFELKKRFNINEYELVNLLNKRVVELMHGAKTLVNDRDSKHDNILVNAINEFLSGKMKPGAK